MHFQSIIATFLSLPRKILLLQNQITPNIAIKHNTYKYSHSFIHSYINYIMVHYISLLSLLFVIATSFDWTPVMQMVDLQYQNGAFPGAVLRVANSTHTLYTYEVGYLGKDSHVPFTQQTVFDIASLSKVSATLSSVMRLYDEGRINTSDPVIKYIPEYNNHNKTSTLLENLLLHNAGLAPDHPDPAHSTK